MIELGTLVIASAIGAWLVKLFSKDLDLKSIQAKNIYTDFAKVHDSRTNVRIMKGLITKSLKHIISKSKRFKIGKTGKPASRNKQHTAYSKTFILCASKDKAFISQLESYYNSKFIEHKKNDNLKQGSAGTSVALNGVYYLYVVVK